RVLLGVASADRPPQVRRRVLPPRTGRGGAGGARHPRRLGRSTRASGGADRLRARLPPAAAPPTRRRLLPPARARVPAGGSVLPVPGRHAAPGARADRSRVRGGGAAVRTRASPGRGDRPWGLARRTASGRPRSEPRGRTGQGVR